MTPLPRKPSVVATRLPTTTRRISRSLRRRARPRLSRPRRRMTTKRTKSLLLLSLPAARRPLPRPRSRMRVRVRVRARLMLPRPRPLRRGAGFQHRRPRTRLMKRSLLLLLLLLLLRDAGLRRRRSRMRLMKRNLLLLLPLPLPLPLPREDERLPPRTLKKTTRPPQRPLPSHAGELRERRRMKLKRSPLQSEGRAGLPPRRHLLSRRMKTLLKSRRKTRSLPPRPRVVVDALARFERVLAKMSRCFREC